MENPLALYCVCAAWKRGAIARERFSSAALTCYTVRVLQRKKNNHNKRDLLSQVYAPLNIIK